jgi:hypothetical protein
MLAKPGDSVLVLRTNGRGKTLWVDGGIYMERLSKVSTIQIRSNLAVHRLICGRTERWCTSEAKRRKGIDTSSNTRMIRTFSLKEGEGGDCC